MAALYDASVCHDSHGGAPTVAAAYRRVWRRLSSRLEPVPGPAPATLAKAGGSQPGTALIDAVQALSAEDKTLLLLWLADSSPETARTGLAVVERHHAQVRERRRIRQNRRRQKRRFWKNRFAA